ncbi:hypothetical protein GWI33_022523 [Rhynchophorus ferrugineus]|uniref:C-type lectin domain-containing protein n=1 Tax=Rhynchophorus ferrugineus TaxID=354439 RepID=A0A834M4F7_RHYFE|nr:hypothetical protein GWI33_022523 [Rhynchophorus ferrugineus]
MDIYKLMMIIILYPSFAQCDEFEAMMFPEADFFVFPDPKICATRDIHLRSPAGVHYYLSWMDKKSPEDWNGARNFCRRMCMDLISLETMTENEWIKNWIEKLRVEDVWTSGRLCTFRGCEKEQSPHLWPLELYGWFWAATGEYLHPSDNPKFTDWSSGGPFGVTQPDNREFRYTGRPEACLAIMNNKYRDGISWHDEVCDFKKPFICEENLDMMEMVKAAAPSLFAKEQHGPPTGTTPN